MLAKALFNNEAESKDELSFKKEDIVTVLEQNTGGLEGWWLCSLRGRQGIAPGNRLQILPATWKGTNRKTSDSTYDIPPSHAWMSPQQAADEDDEYDVPRQQGKGAFFDAVDGSTSPNDVYDVPKASAWLHSSFNDEVYDTPTSTLNRSEIALQEVYNVPNSFSIAPDPKELYDVPPIVSRDYHPDDVYDVPPKRSETMMSDMIPVLNPEEVYDVPPSALRSDSAGFQATRHESVDSDVVYDIPQSNKIAGGTFVSSGLNSLRRMKREMKESLRAAAAEDQAEVKPKPEFIYDVPPQVTRDSGSSSSKPSADDVVDGLLQRLSLSSDVVDAGPLSNRISTHSRESFNRFVADNRFLQLNELDVGLEEALKNLITLKQNLEDAVSKLLMLVKENWRKAENIAGKIHEVQKSFVDVLISVNAFIVYARGATANASSSKLNKEKAPQKVQAGLQKFLVPLEEDLEMLKGALSELDANEWNIDKLAVDGNNEDGTILDEVDSFVMTSRAVSDDAAQMAIYVHTHAQYIFRKESDVLSVAASPTKSLSSESVARPVQEIQARPLPVPPTNNKPMPVVSTAGNTEQEGWLDDYDYVALPDAEDSSKNDQNSKSKKSSVDGLNKRKTQLLSLEKEVTHPKIEVYSLNPQEKEILKTLEIDVPDLVTSLSIAIDNFITAVDGRKPPPSFVALGKHAILCAHKLVFVGDCVCQHISLGPARSAVQEQCSTMCSILKRTVASTKLAALQWPSVSAMQDMVDKMFEIATCAHQIRLTLKSILSV